ncbi:MAG: riboflavin synthase [Gammaproteobacteria bacterium]|nr:MAG: riboflavin synthase [Gammaproteobacteria bacterium]
MFTGIVQTTGTIEALTPRGGDVRLAVRCPELGAACGTVGDSISVGGVCLTAIELDENGFSADVSRETLDHTTLGRYKPGGRVNLEKALTLATPLGGHLVTGHVDGIGEVLDRRDDARSIRFGIRVPGELSRYVARKGSVCLDGVSLTVNDVSGDRFGVNIVPHTLEVTTLDEWMEGVPVNVEVDIVARYLERLLGDDSSRGLSLEKLKETGFAESH